MKRGTYEDEKGALMIKVNVHLLKEKGHRSDFNKGMYRRWKGGFYEKGEVTLIKRKKEAHVKINRALIKDKKG